MNAGPKTSKRRSSLNRRLWSLVKRLPGGEETMRDMVAVLRREDGSGADLAGSPRFTSTRLLTDQQLLQLIERVGAKVPDERRRAPEGAAQVTFLASPGERRYLDHLAEELGWSPEHLNAFIDRQTQGRGLRTHNEAQAVVLPLERMLREKGYDLVVTGRKKWLVPPREETRNERNDERHDGEERGGEAEDSDALLPHADAARAEV